MGGFPLSSGPLYWQRHVDVQGLFAYVQDVFLQGGVSLRGHCFQLVSGSEFCIITYPRHHVCPTIIPTPPG